MLVDLRVGLAVAELETLQGRVTGRIGQTLSEAVDAVRQHYEDEIKRNRETKKQRQYFV